MDSGNHSSRPVFAETELSMGLSLSFKTITVTQNEKKYICSCF